MKQIILAVCLVLAIPCSGAADDPAKPLSHRSTALAKADGRLFVAGSGGLSVWDEEGRGPLGWRVLPGACLELLVFGESLFLSCGPQGLVRLARGEGVPEVQDRWVSSGAVYQVAPAGEDRLLVADGVMGVRLVSISGPAGLETLATYDPGLRARGVVVDGHRAFVSAGVSGLVVLDFEDGQLREIGRLKTEEARELTLMPGGRRAVVADGVGGLLLVDLSTPSPKPLDRVAPVGVDRVRGVDVSGEIVACAEGTSGVRFFKATAEGKLEQLSFLPELAGEVTDVLFDRSGDSLRAFLAADRAGVLVVDLSDLRNPALN